ncbi:hypothetical protein TMatcc_010409 [Talaromyces marneffei ATCC 18224]|uniref:uncharacterized protein n=1 Tax=Talaromyces marneffei TaxID=37727 RepID=UPI0012A7EB55|nr:uncharacterized protein EYB26_009798 [Talaromyces marneffei]KAE8548741.1 hypothetical protein EYB25_009122 [Talaromyces marneffei]QGA22084.1 hypothetical protein EYB26_009798 [Talaromyces marneffei]
MALVRGSKRSRYGWTQAEHDLNTFVIRSDQGNLDGNVITDNKFINLDRLAAAFIDLNHGLNSHGEVTSGREHSFTTKAVVTEPSHISDTEDITLDRLNSRVTRHADTQDIVQGVLDGTVLKGLTRLGPELSGVVPHVGWHVNNNLTLEELSSGVFVTDQRGDVSKVVVAKLPADLLDRARKSSMGLDLDQSINGEVVGGSKSLDSLVEQHGADQVLAPARSSFCVRALDKDLNASKHHIQDKRGVA